MSERDMTPEERERFERKQVQHRDNEQAATRPASDPEHHEHDKESGQRTVIPNPD